MISSQLVSRVTNTKLSYYRALK